jgi:ectoine hydroxylase-related dioxygenase (phytanoyl-CoA dioxygenase family)
MSSRSHLAQYDLLVDRIDVDGWATTGAVVEDDSIDRVAGELPAVETNRGGVRDLLAVAPGVGALADHPGIRAIAQAVLGPDCFVVRALLFDKTAETNWKVAWHQDLSIAVVRRIDVGGYGPWSVKGGVIHVQPPVEILERMLAVRVHLDHCGPENGPVRVLPGSHGSGRLSADEIARRTATVEAVTCSVVRGGVLAFRPLILHASSQAVAPARRRVVHFEFAACGLSGGLKWQTRR